MMNIKKIGGGLVVAISMLAFNASAQETCESLVDEMAGNGTTITGKAKDLRCAKNGGTWIPEPFWQFKGGKGKKGEAGDGCDIHEKLAKLIYEVREVGDSEPWKGKKNKNGNNVAKGAAQALGDGQLEYAVQLLEELQSSIATSKPNSEYGGDDGKDNDGKTAAERAYWVSYWADTMAKRIIADDGTRCIE